MQPSACDNGNKLYSTGAKFVLRVFSSAVLVEVLVTIAERCPQVLCDSDHYCVLLGAYSATMSRTGQQREIHKTTTY